MTGGDHDFVRYSQMVSESRDTMLRLSCFLRFRLHHNLSLTRHLYLPRLGAGHLGFNNGDESGAGCKKAVALPSCVYTTDSKCSHLSTLEKISPFPTSSMTTPTTHSAFHSHSLFRPSHSVLSLVRLALGWRKCTWELESRWSFRTNDGLEAGRPPTLKRGNLLQFVSVPALSES